MRHAHVSWKTAKKEKEKNISCSPEHSQNCWKLTATIYEQTKIQGRFWSSFHWCHFWVHPVVSVKLRGGTWAYSRPQPGRADIKCPLRSVHWSWILVPQLLNTANVVCHVQRYNKQPHTACLMHHWKIFVLQRSNLFTRLLHHFCCLLYVYFSSLITWPHKMILKSSISSTLLISYICHSQCYPTKIFISQWLWGFKMLL